MLYWNFPIPFVNFKPLSSTKSYKFYQCSKYHINTTEHNVPYAMSTIARIKCCAMYVPYSSRNIWEPCFNWKNQLHHSKSVWSFFSSIVCWKNGIKWVASSSRFFSNPIHIYHTKATRSVGRYIFTYWMNSFSRWFFLRRIKTLNL